MEPAGKSGGMVRRGTLKDLGKDWARGLVKAVIVVTVPTLSSRIRVGKTEIDFSELWAP